MSIAFIILLLFTAELTFQCGSFIQQGFSPYPFGAPLVLTLTHGVLLTLCIYYFGWLFGIIAFLLHMFSLLHFCFTWVFSIPSILYLSHENPHSSFRVFKPQKLSVIYHILLSWVLVADILFMIISFFTVPFMTAKTYFFSDTKTWVILIVSALIGFILRTIVSKAVAFQSDIK